MQSVIQPFKQGVLFSRGDFKVYFLQDMYEPVFNSFILSNNLKPSPHKLVFEQVYHVIKSISSNQLSIDL